MRFIPTIANPIDPKEAALKNTLVLAYLGDAVQSLYVRSKLCITDLHKSGELHHKAIEEVSAKAQSHLVDDIIGLFTEEEMMVYRRAKNSKPHSMSKNAEPEDYHKATGFEAVLGYLYLSGQNQRLDLLLNYAEEK